MEVTPRIKRNGRLVVVAPQRLNWLAGVGLVHLALASRPKPRGGKKKQARTGTLERANAYAPREPNRLSIWGLILARA